MHNRFLTRRFRRRLARLATGAVILAGTTVPALAAAPSLGVSDQQVSNGVVVIDDVDMPAGGFVAIHAAKADGTPAVPASIGHAAVAAGASTGVRIALSAPVSAGDTLFAMLHTDSGKKRVYEFAPGSVSEDKPVVADGKPVLARFTVTAVTARQAPALPGAQPISPRDRVYTADQSSNTVTVIDPAAEKVLGTIALGAPRIAKSLAPVNPRQENVHGLGFSADGSALTVTSVSSNALQIIDPATNAVALTGYIGRSPHESVPSPDGKTVWVAIRGENYVSVLDRASGAVVDRIETAPGDSKVAFSPDGTRAYVNHLFTPKLSVIDVASRTVVGEVSIPAAAGGSADLAVAPDGKEVWLGHPITGKTTVIDAATLTIKAVLDTGPRTNHPNFVTRDGIDYTYVTVGGLNQTKIFRRSAEGGPEFVTAIEHAGVGPHGIWPSPDNTRVYVALQKSDAVDIIDTATNQVVKTLRVGQDPQALVYVADAVPEGADAVPEGGANLANQGLDMRVENLPIEVRDIDGAKGSANIRSVSELDEIDIAARGLPANKTFTVYAAKGSSVQALRDVTANAGGVVGEALAYVDFFGNYDRVILVPKGSRP